MRAAWILCLGLLPCALVGATEADDILLRASALETRSALLLLEHIKVEDALVAADNDRLTVFFSLQQPSPVLVDELALTSNGKALLRYRVSAADLAKLQAGAVQPLYVGKISTGEHSIRLEVKVRQGKAPRPEALTVVKTEGPRFVEFTLLSEPVRAIKVVEW